MSYLTVNQANSVHAGSNPALLTTVVSLLVGDFIFPLDKNKKLWYTYFIVNCECSSIGRVGDFQSLGCGIVPHRSLCENDHITSNRKKVAFLVKLNHLALVSQLDREADF